MKDITVMIIGLLIVVCVGTVVGVLLKRRVHKMVDRVDQRRLEIYHRNIPEEIAKVKKLTMSGQTEKQFESWRALWDQLVDVRLPNLEEALVEVESLTARYKMKAAKVALAEVEQELTEINVQLDKMVAEIGQFVEAEKENRADIEGVRASYRKLSALLIQKRVAFGESLSALDAEMADMKQQLALFEQLTENGDYLQARTLLIALIERLSQLEGQAAVIPTLLVKAKTTFPHELSQLIVGIRQMEDSGYHLASFRLDEKVAALQSVVEVAYNEIGALQVDEASARLTAVEREIEDLYEVLEKEVQSQKQLQAMLPSFKEIVANVKGQLDALLNETIHVKKSYLLSEAEANLHELLRKELMQHQQQLQVIVDMTEAENETFTATNEKAVLWRQQMQSLSDKVAQGLERLRCLRKEELQAKEVVTRLRTVMLETKRKLHKSNIPGVPVILIEALDEAEQKVNTAKEALTHTPLEMDKIEQWLNEAIALVEDNATQAETLINDARLAEQVIQYSNRYRGKSTEVRERLLHAEQAFLAYEYQQAIEVAQEAVASYDGDVVQKVTQLLNTK
ncbi:septation ring formation regulator EzrA [Bacillus sp. FSL W7-1360]